MMSFANEDSARVDQFLRILRRHQVPYFEFRRDVAPGSNIVGRVQDAIEKCTHVIIYLSAASVNAPWVWFEVGIAFARRRTLVFILDHPSIRTPLPFDYLRHITSKAEFERFAKSIARQNEDPASHRHMAPVEEAAREKLYYHEDGWARAIRLWGAEDILFSEDAVSVEYEHIPFEPPPELAERMRQAIIERTGEAEAAGRVFFNGPNVRLLTFRVSPKDELAAIETPHLTLRLGPIGWYDYEGLNEAFRDQLKDSPPIPLYRYYIGIHDLVDHADVTKNKLSNILDNAVTIITTDGYVLYGRRTRRVTGSGLFTSVVAENVNRYLDDTDSASGELINRPSVTLPNTIPPPALDGSYTPIGVPSPFSTVKRGISSEFSPRLAREMQPSFIKVTGLAFDLDIFHPTLLFCVFTPFRRDELLQWREDEPGSETYEVTVHATVADSQSPHTTSLLREENWVQTGKASLIRAIEVIETIQRKYTCSFEEAVNVASRL